MSSASPSTPPVPLVTRKTLERTFQLAVFLGLVVLLRHLILLLVFFVAFAWPLDAASRWLERRVGLSRRLAVLGMALSFLAGIVGLIALAVVKGVRAAPALQGAARDFIDAVQRNPIYQSAHDRFGGTDKLVEIGKAHAGEAVGYLSAFGHGFLFALIAFIIAVVFLVEKHELDEFRTQVDPKSLGGTLLRWLGYVAEAMAVTLQFQLVVALCNAALTFPVMWLVGMHHKGAFFFMVFASGLVPVVGNFVAGAILAVQAYNAAHWFGLGAFVVLTAVLHKLESYYLNPHLAQRHVHLPAFALIVSLIIFEHVFGFVGLFLSFPCLFVAMRIRKDFVHDDVGLASPLAVVVRPVATQHAPPPPPPRSTLVGVPVQPPPAPAPVPVVAAPLAPSTPVPVAVHDAPVPFAVPAPPEPHVAVTGATVLADEVAPAEEAEVVAEEPSLSGVALAPPGPPAAEDDEPEVTVIPGGPDDATPA